VAALLVLTLPVTVLAEWSEWMSLNRERGVWTRIEMSPPAREQRFHHQFRNDGDQAVEIDCTLGSYVIAPPTYKRLTDVRLRLLPGGSSDPKRFVHGEHPVVADCGVTFFDVQPNWAEMASHEANPEPRGAFHE
jgi:hypothetical protein